MIAYEIQLRYVIQDKIQSEKKSEKKKIIRKKIVKKKKNSEKNGLRWCLGFPVCKVSCLGQIMLLITKQYIHTATMIFHIEGAFPTHATDAFSCQCICHCRIVPFL